MNNNNNLPAFPPSSEYIKKFNEGYHEPCGMTKLEYFSLEIFKSTIMTETNNVTVGDVEEYLGLKEGSYNPEKHWDLYLSKITIGKAKSLLSELSKEI